MTAQALVVYKVAKLPVKLTNKIHFVHHTTLNHDHPRMPHAGSILPVHPLLHPRRLTDGSLSNSLNAWGAVTSSPPRSNLASPGSMFGEVESGEWAPSSPSYTAQSGNSFASRGNTAVSAGEPPSRLSSNTGQQMQAG